MTADNVAKTVGKYRWIICLLLFANTANNYLDRQMLGILVPLLEKKYNWSELDWARVVIAFQVAYAVGLPFFGRMVDKFGTRATYAWATIFWGFAAYGHAFCSRALHFGIVRFILGLGEAVNFPAAIKAITEWFPKKERALATGIFNSGANIGAVITPALIPWLAINYGWQWAFVVGGSINFVFVALWWPLYRRPQEHKGVLQSELKHILGDSGREGQAKIPWRDLLRYRETWAFILGKFMTDPIWWFYLFWLPKWLAKDFNLNLGNLGWPLIVVYTFVTIGSVGGGYISSALMNAGRSVNFARKAAFLICATLVVPIFAVTQVGNVWLAVLLVGLAAAAHQGWSANLFTLVSDCFPKNAVASVVGIGGMAGSIGAIMFAEFVGRVLQKTGQYWLLFLIGSTAYLLAFVVIHLLVPRIRTVEVAGVASDDDEDEAAEARVASAKLAGASAVSPLAGFDGWLLVPASALVMVPLIAVVTLVLTLAQATADTAGTARLFFGTSVAAQGLLVVLMLVAAARFFDRRRNAPGLMVGLQVVQVVLAAVVFLIGRSIPGGPPAAWIYIFLLVLSVVTAAAMIPYFRTSARVRETFVV